METNYKINSEFKATIFDRSNKTLEVRNEDYFQLFRSLRGNLSINHGVEFYKKLFEAVEEYEAIEPNFDINDLIGVLDNQITENKMLKEIYIQLKDDMEIDDIVNSPFNKFLLNDYHDSLIPAEELLEINEMFENENIDNHNRLKSIFREAEAAYYYDNDTKVVFTDNNNIPIIMEFKDFSEQEIIKELVYANFINMNDILDSEYLDDRFNINKFNLQIDNEKLEKIFNEYRFDFDIDKYELCIKEELEKNNKINKYLTEDEKQLINSNYQYEYAYLKEINQNDSIEGKIFNYFNNLESSNFNDIDDILMDLNMNKNQLQSEINKMNENIPNLIEIIEEEQTIGINSTKLFIYDIVQNYKITNLIFEYQENINRYNDNSREENGAEKIYGFNLKEYFDENIVDQENKKQKETELFDNQIEYSLNDAVLDQLMTDTDVHAINNILKENPIHFSENHDEKIKELDNLENETINNLTQEPVNERAFKWQHILTNDDIDKIAHSILMVDEEELKIENNVHILSSDNPTNYKLINERYVEIGEHVNRSFGHQTESEADENLKILLEKFSNGEIHYDEQQRSGNENDFNEIVTKYNKEIFDNDRYRLILGISETDEEIIVKRGNSNPSNWDIKSFNKKAGYIVELKNIETLEETTQFREKLIYQGYSEKQELDNWENILLDEKSIVSYISAVNEVVDSEKLGYYKTDIHVQEENDNSVVLFEINNDDNLEIQDYILRNINNVPYKNKIIEDYGEYIEQLTDAVVLNKELDIEKLTDEFKNNDLTILNEIMYQTLIDENFKYKFERVETIEDYGEKIEKKIEKPLKIISDNICRQNIHSMLKDNPLNYQEEAEQLVTKFNKNINSKQLESKNENLQKYFNSLTIDKYNDVMEVLNNLNEDEMFDELEENNLKKLTTFNSDEKIIFKEVLEELEVNNKLDLIIARAVDTLTEEELSNLKDLDLGLEVKEQIKNKEEEINEKKNPNRKLIIEKEFELE